MNKNPEPFSDNLVFIQNWLRPALTPVLENRDHRRPVDDLKTIDQSLKASEPEAKAIEFALENLPQGVSQSSVIDVPGLQSMPCGQNCCIK